MVEEFSKKITNKLIKEKIVKSEEQEIYDYCFEIAIVSIISHFVLFILAIIFGELLCSLIFLITFSLFRRICGGYHAKSYVKCTIISLLSFLLLILVIKKLNLFFVSNLFNVIVGLCIIMILAPKGDFNKPITKKQYKLFKRISRILASILMILFLIIYSIFSNSIFENKFFFSLCYGIDLVAFSLLISNIERRIRNAKI